MTGLFTYITVHLAGTLAANQQGAFVVPHQGATLLSVSATGSNANNAKLRVGIGGASADDDAFMTDKDIGDSSAFLTYGPKEFDGVKADVLKISAPHLNKGDVVTWLLDFDGAAGTAAQNVDIQFTLLEG